MVEIPSKSITTAMDPNATVSNNPYVYANPQNHQASTSSQDQEDSEDEDYYYDHETLPSTISRLAAQHTTEGYRDGITESKGVHIQTGFDEGYILGAALGLSVGEILGILDGMVGCLNGALGKYSSSSSTTTTSILASSSTSISALRSPSQSSSSKSSDDDGKDMETTLQRIKQTRETARAELSLEKVFGREYFGEDGIWKWHVEGEDEEEEEETFDDIVAQHPLIRKWMGTVAEMVKDIGLLLRQDERRVRGE